MFAQIDTLPSAKTQSSGFDGYGAGAPQERRLNMCGHIVGPFARVPIGKRLGRDRGQAVFQIKWYIAVGIFIDRERGGGVLEE